MPPLGNYHVAFVIVDKLTQQTRNPSFFVPAESAHEAAIIGLARLMNNGGHDTKTERLLNVTIT